MSYAERRQGPRVRKCNVCQDELYPDEPGAYCQDCRAVCARKDDNGGHPKPDGHEERILAHMRRVEPFLPPPGSREKGGRAKHG